MTRLRPLFAALLVAALAAAPATATSADDYSDPAYRDSDVDSMTRSLGRQRTHLTSVEYGTALLGTGPQTWLENQGRAVNDLRAGRVYTGLAQNIPGGGVGDPERYHEVGWRRVSFLSRTGAKLNGRVWGSEAPGPRPGVVITTGSIQGSQHMYFWAARELAHRGYVVLTWDVQGQGESDTFGHAPGSPEPTFDGVPFQQAGNFHDGTVDALRFFLSTPEEPFRPVGWSDEDAATAAAAAEGVEQLDWVNPGWGSLDRGNLALAGHSLGAGAVGAVQQCSDEAELWADLSLCAGQSFPIRAVVAWDSLGAGVTPVVPAMDQRADGYFFNPTPSYSAPNPDGSLGAFNRWRDAGLDAYTVVVRGGTHLEWTEIPYILPATAYGTELASFYTAAWIDRWLHPDPQARIAAHGALLDGPDDDPEQPWSANHLSVRFRSAFSLHDPEDAEAPLAETTDIRAWAGRSAVGDWEGANADTIGRELP